MFVNFNILNQLGSPAINSNTFANRPAAGQTGRLFVSTDTFEIYRDNGTTWDLIGGPGSSTITGTGTATQVAYFTSSQAIGSSANLYWDNTNTRLGIGTSTPGVRLDIHGTGIMQHINATSATANSLMAFQRTGTNVWRLGDQYNGGSNYFELHNTALANNAIQIDAATNKSILTSIESYSTGLARGNYLDYTLSLPNATTFTSPNTVTALGATLNLNIAGSATIPAGARSGADFFNGINFTSAGTFTVNQASTIRAFSNVTAGWAFNGSAVGTVTHLAGLRVLFPTNSGSAINVTDNYALLINNQNANTGTITYTNRWGIYQEGASDLNYMAANLLLGSTVNTGDKLQVTGTTYLSSQLTVGNTLYVDTVFNRVGIGTLSPAYTLDVNGTGRFGYTNNNNNAIVLLDGNARQSHIGSAFGATFIQNNNYYNGSAYVFDDNTQPNATISLSLGTINFQNSLANVAPSTKMTLDLAGNLGLGLTPNSWFSNSKALQIGGTLSPYLSLFQQTVSTADGYLGWGVYLTGDRTFAYTTTGDAVSAYRQNAGQHTWLTASSGTAGNAVTFTQAMTLGANGNLLIGTTTDAGSGKLQVTGGIAAYNGSGGYTNYMVDTSSGGAWGFIARNRNNLYLREAGVNDQFIFYAGGNFEATNGSIKTAAPTTGTAAAWKLGSRVAATVVLNTTQYIEVDIGGTLYKLATVT